MSGLIMDAVLAAVGLAHLVGSARHGLGYAVASVLGLLAGAVAGLLVIPWVVAAYAGPESVTLAGSATTMLVGLTAWIGMVLASESAQQRRANAQRSGLISPAGTLLSGAGGFGVALVTISVLFAGFAQVAWNSTDVTLARAAAQSQILTRVGPLMPPQVVGQALARLPRGAATPGEVLDPGGVTAATTAELPTVAEVSAAADIAESTVMKISGNAAACGRGQTGSGFVFAPQYVMTNAHVVAAVDAPLVQPGGAGRQYTADVVYFDPAGDIAVLHSPDLPSPATTLGPVPAASDDVAVLGYPLGGPYTVTPGVMVRDLTSKTRDIYDEAIHERPVLVLRAGVRSGNSGGPVINAQGETVGVVFARSAVEDGVGYAVPTAALREVMEVAQTLEAPVETGGCVSE